MTRTTLEIHRDGARARVATRGCTVVSFVVDGDELLYLAPSARRARGALRGGIPLCVPQFADRGPLKKHGLARDVDWTIVESTATSVHMQLDTSSRATARTSSAAAAARDDGHWLFECRVWIDDERRLCHKLTAKTLAGAAAAVSPLTMCFHTYLRVADVTRVGVDGLTSRGRRTLEGEVDVVYAARPGPFLVHDSDGEHDERVIEVRSGRSTPDVVLWNPHVAKARALVDLPDDDWRHFVCVEPGVVEAPLALKRGSVFEATQTIALVKSKSTTKRRKIQ